MNTKTSKTKLTVMIGIFSAIAFLLQCLGSMMGIRVGGFLDVEISDVPALIISFAYGPLAGVLVELIKNVLHLSISSTGFVGEFANFIITGILCFVAGITYRYHKSFKGAILSLILATVAISLSGVLVNLFIMLPLYMKDVDFSQKLSICLKLILPFNAAKGIVLSGITMLIYKKISKFIK